MLQVISKDFFPFSCPMVKDPIVHKLMKKPIETTCFFGFCITNTDHNLCSSIFYYVTKWVFKMQWFYRSKGCEILVKQNTIKEGEKQAKCQIKTSEYIFAVNTCMSKLGDFGALLSCNLIIFPRFYIEVSWRPFPERCPSLFLAFRSGPTLGKPKRRC